jgi:hypothetical protein
MVRPTLRISCEGRTTWPSLTMTAGLHGPTMVLPSASNRPSSAASACSTATLTLHSTMLSPAKRELRQIVRPIHAGATTHTTQEGVARRARSGGKAGMAAAPLTSEQPSTATRPREDERPNVLSCRRSPGSAVFLLAREGRFIVRAEGTSDVRL